jgi:hypothetical protein
VRFDGAKNEILPLVFHETNKENKGLELAFGGFKCHDLNLGLMTKANAWKGASRQYNRGVTCAFPRM